MSLIAPRTPVRFTIKTPEMALNMAIRLVQDGNVVEGFDLIEQLLDMYPALNFSILEIACTLYQSLPDQGRYNLYQARHFNFNIKPGDKVLDLGSGHDPFPFATHLVDIAVTDNTYGRAGMPFKMLQGREVYECSVEKTPFADKEFDFVYCSHVLEHVNSPEAACREIMRIGKKGYIETPNKGKDIFLNTARISNHRWTLELFGEELIFSEYTRQEQCGLNCSILLDMHCNPQTAREKIFSALMLIKSPLLNTMMMWQDDFAFSVRRQPPGTPLPIHKG